MFYEQISNQQYNSYGKELVDLTLLDLTELSIFLESDTIKNIPTIYGRQNISRDDVFCISFYYENEVENSYGNKWEWFIGNKVPNPYKNWEDIKEDIGIDNIPNRHLMITKNIDEYFFIYYTQFDIRRGCSRLLYVADQIDGLIEFLSDMMFQSFPKDNFLIPANDYFIPDPQGHDHADEISIYFEYLFHNARL